MIRKVSHEGIGHTVVDLQGVQHIFVTATPQTGSTFQEQAFDALRAIRSVVDEKGTSASIVRQTVFLRDADQIDACRQIIQDFYGADLPVTDYILQPPCDGKHLLIEAFSVGGKSDVVSIQRHSDHLVVVDHSGIQWVHCAGISPETSATGMHDRSIDAFKRMQDVVAAAGAEFEQVIRTWLYLGDIIGPEGETQRYKELNRARTDYYRDFHFAKGQTPARFDKTVYPASTGIGTNGTNLVMGCLAMVTDRDDVAIVPLENPQQTSACDYSSEYSPKSPKFARAMAIAFDDCATIFVSGTASITGSETQHKGDVEKQTHQTLDNIATLISEDNFCKHDMPGLGISLDQLAFVRVYVKYPEDFAKTRAVCESRLGDIPTIYSIADVCRHDLLVEIEGIGFSQRK